MLDLLVKAAGGPGSGVSGNNTKPIGMPQSEFVSVGTRKGILDNMPFTERSVQMSAITAVGQANYVPKKLKRMVDKIKAGDADLLEMPIDLLRVRPGEYNVIDGHHRFLAAKQLGKKTIKARIYARRKETKVAEKREGQEGWSLPRPLGIAGTVVGSMGAREGLGYAAMAAQDAALDMHDALSTKEEKYWRSLGRRKTRQINKKLVELAEFKGPVKYVGEGGQYIPAKGRIETPKYQPAVLAHELGHSRGLMKHAPWRYASGLSRVLTNLGARSPRLGLVGLVADTPEEALGMAAIPAALSVPNLAEEARASISGARMLSKATEGQVGVAKTLKRVLPAWGSYVVPAAKLPLSILATGLIASGLKGISTNKNEKQEKTSAARGIDMHPAFVGGFLKVATGFRDEVAEFLQKNPNPSDDEFHDFAESLGVEPDDLEGTAYQLATERAQQLGRGDK